MKTIKIGNEEVKLDPELLKFTDATINQFLQKYAALYDYYMQKHAEAKYIHGKFQDKHDAVSSEKFASIKEGMGGSDKLVEAKVKGDPEVQELAEKIRISGHHVDSLWGFLRSMDRAHEDAMQTCYNLRKELDKIYSTVKKSEF
jgi:hypothetical protein